MRLYELAFGCRIYGALTGYDSSLVRLQQITGNQVDPYDPVHRRALFKWLNGWGCRQFSTAHHETIASPSLVAWAEIWMPKLPPAGAQLDELDRAEIGELGNAYGDLHRRMAGVRTLRSGSTSNVTYGPTGAAKTLFALRPNLCPPWDAYTLRKLGLGHSAEAYTRYLLRVLSDLRDLANDVGVKITDLAPLVGRPDSTPPKLIDEYYWVTITRRFVPPTPDELAQWLAWAVPEGRTSP